MSSYIYIDDILWTIIKEDCVSSVFGFEAVVLSLINVKDLSNDIFIVFPKSITDEDKYSLEGMRDTQLGLVRMCTIDGDFAVFLHNSYINYITTATPYGSV